MNPWLMLFFLLLMVGLLGVLLYYLLVVTEGVYLGRRMVVWLYDITAHRYDAIKALDPEMEHWLLARPLHRQVAHIPAPRILDVATGTGRLPLALLNEPLFQGRVVGLDASWRMLQQAAPRLRPYGDRATLVQQTADRLPFPPDYFDAVTCVEALEFLSVPETAVREMIRVLKPGGVLLLTRRRGRNGRLFLGRYCEAEPFAAWLQSLGLSEIQQLRWQVEYDQVYARKPGRDA